MVKLHRASDTQTQSRRHTSECVDNLMKSSKLCASYQHQLLGLNVVLQPCRVLTPGEAWEGHVGPADTRTLLQLPVSL